MLNNKPTGLQHGNQPKIESLKKNSINNETEK
jgi:hypothetical protein